MTKKISLKQFLMRTGSFESSLHCESAIRSREITINNEIVANPYHFFNPKTSLVKINGEKLNPIKKLYFIMNKPAGYICQKSKSEKNIYALLGALNLSKESIASLFAVGRLDKDTEGLLLITNHGRLSSILTEPKNEIVKKYYAVLEKPADINKLKMLEKGVEIEIEHKIYKTKKSIIKKTGEKEVYISISEGRKRQIRKMFEKIGNEVVYLKRVSIGGLQLGKLGAGEIKQITREEIIKKLEF